MKSSFASRPDIPYELPWCLGPGLSGLLSIVVTAYNQDWVLDETLRSIAAQTYRPLECVIVNDGSSDETPRIISRFVDRYGDDLRVVAIEQENAGAQRARNRGVCASHGEFITFLDGDDVLAPHKSEVQLLFLRSREGAQSDVAYSDAKWLVQRGDEFEAGDYVGLGFCQDVLTSLLRMDRWNPPFVYVCRRRAIQATGAWDPQIRINQDFEYFLRMASKAQRFAYVPGMAGYYRKHFRARISQAGILLRAQDTLSILKKAEQLMQQHHLLDGGRREVLSYAYRSVSCWAFQYDRALWKESLTHALRLCPSIRPRNSVGRSLQALLGIWRSEWLFGLLRPAKQQFRATEHSAI